MEPEYEDSLIGRTIAGKFAIVGFLGGGSMGKVYQARQLGLDKSVAVKVMNRALARDEAFAVRFYREAKAAARLDHPNSTRVLDFGEEPDGLLYIAMEYLDGRDLEQVILKESPLDTRRIVAITTQMLSAIAVAHDVGIIHRDLKPENVMLIRGVDEEGAPREMVKVCDFGIAKLVDRTTDGPARTTSGLVVGTPEYMSPEQGKGESVDARSDLYSVGVLLYQMITGRVPFEAETAIAIVFRHVTEEPKNPSAWRPGVDPRLEQICLRALKKDKDERFQTAREMRTALRQILRSEGEGVVIPISQPLRMPITAPPTALSDGPNVAAHRSTKRSTPRLIPWIAAAALVSGALGMRTWIHRSTSRATALEPHPAIGGVPPQIVAPPARPEPAMAPTVELGAPPPPSATKSNSPRGPVHPKPTIASAPPEPAQAEPEPTNVSPPPEPPPVLPQLPAVAPEAVEIGPSEPASAAPSTSAAPVATPPVPSATPTAEPHPPPAAPSTNISPKPAAQPE